MKSKAYRSRILALWFAKSIVMAVTAKSKIVFSWQQQFFKKKVPGVLAETRTLDPLIKSQLLYQLSYEDKWTANIIV